MVGLPICCLSLRGTRPLLASSFYFEVWPDGVWILRGTIDGTTEVGVERRVACDGPEGSCLCPLSPSLQQSGLILPPSLALHRCALPSAFRHPFFPFPPLALLRRGVCETPSSTKDRDLFGPSRFPFFPELARAARLEMRPIGRLCTFAAARRALPLGLSPSAGRRLASSSSVVETALSSSSSSAKPAGVDITPGEVLVFSAGPGARRIILGHWLSSVIVDAYVLLSNIASHLLPADPQIAAGIAEASATNSAAGTGVGIGAALMSSQTGWFGAVMAGAGVAFTALAVSSSRAQVRHAVLSADGHHLKVYTFSPYFGIGSRKPIVLPIKLLSLAGGPGDKVEENSGKPQVASAPGNDGKASKKKGSKFTEDLFVRVSGITRPLLILGLVSFLATSLLPLFRLSFCFAHRRSKGLHSPFCSTSPLISLSFAESEELVLSLTTEASSASMPAHLPRPRRAPRLRRPLRPSASRPLRFTPTPLKFVRPSAATRCLFVF